ncbi:hypothetical protein SAMN04488590_3159 [Microbacterium sp. 77mftsu3.1]|nr:hypothetical protein SAMN04488590_3159 [Microbacterium sp. 77mftsu3.1]
MAAPNAETPGFTVTFTSPIAVQHARQFAQIEHEDDSEDMMAPRRA